MNKKVLKQLILATDYAGTTVSKEFKKGFREGMKISADMLEQLDESQKPVVPKFVAEWIEQAKKERQSLYEAMYNIESSTYYHKYDNATYQWMFEGALHDEHQELFAEVYMHGYEVEKEPLYYVRLPYEVWDEEAAELKPEYLYLHYEITSDETRMFPTKEPRKGFVAKLDELTIKSADERYWAFAVPVEEVAEG
ncbi:DUF1642 domain-containing protein [Enterococcus faecium]|uniref:DUF1642 domain-containing protein n=1 Tax=Enterococcus faecium TaxID=1352 RepID=UPI00288FDDAF|nr:DUF1642 domain-containing protein [Enterococcus faecium]MDT2290524.1 DUF1642 domain-containing protein [Enterococcus faecium]